VLALITNDDGIDSPGLVTLARGALEAGYEVIVAAPHGDSTGVGASVYAVAEQGRVRVHTQQLPGLDVPAFSVEAHPAFIVHSAGEGWFDTAPDLVLSGINIGANVGRAVIHSGTVGAALTGALHGWSALAASLDCGLAGAATAHWDTVLAVLPETLAVLRERARHGSAAAAGGHARHVRLGARPGGADRGRRRGAGNPEGQHVRAGRHRSAGLGRRAARRRARDPHRAPLDLRGARPAVTFRQATVTAAAPSAPRTFT
jgi:hypothetical protein